MIKKRKLLLGFILLFALFAVCSGTVIAVSGVNMKITGTIGNYTSDVWLKTDSNAGTGFDAYDLEIRGLPSGSYSQFYSSITGKSLAIDSWNPTSRTLSLVYDVPSGQTGNVVFSWNSVSGTGYEATFTVTGSATGSKDMRDYSSYTHTISSDSDIYITVQIEDYTEEVGEAAPGGGGAPSVPAERETIVIDNKIIDVYLVLNEVKTRKISLYNKGYESVDVSLSVKELEDVLILKEKSFEIMPGQRKQVDVRVVAPEKPGIYTGKIIVKGITSQEILVTIHANTKELLFDVSVVIPDEFKVINQEEKLPAQITLIPMGEEPRLDVTLTYLIKDFDGRTFLSESDTMLVESQKTFKKEFSTQNLPIGKYILGLELGYINGLATSSDHFEVKEALPGLPVLSKYGFVLVILGIGILVLLLLIILVLARSRKIKKSRKFKR